MQQRGRTGPQKGGETERGGIRNKKARLAVCTPLVTRLLTPVSSSTARRLHDEGGAAAGRVKVIQQLSFT